MTAMYSMIIGVALGSIIATIITVHIATSSNMCRTSHAAVMAHADAPVIDPYMSALSARIHDQDTNVTSARPPITMLRSWRRANSRSDGGEGRLAGAGAGLLDNRDTVLEALGDVRMPRLVRGRQCTSGRALRWNECLLSNGRRRGRYGCGRRRWKPSPVTSWAVKA